MTAPRLWFVVPAAGCGQRMLCEFPKQYLRLAGRSMLDWTLSRCLEVPQVEAVLVCTGSEDQLFAQQSLAGHPRVRRVAGGAERAHSVLNGLRALKGQAAADDVVLVHDAARPLLSLADAQAVVAAVRAGQGAVLAQPVADTLKRAGADGLVVGTEPREGLWQAQTPQAAPYAVLLEAMEAAVAGAAAGKTELPTDEAMALEQAGVPVCLVAASQPNFKLTTPADLGLAEALLQAQGAA